jgi:signal transduction histidine kinase
MNQSFLKIHGCDPSERADYIHTDWRSIYNEKGWQYINNTVLPSLMIKGAWTGELKVMRKDGSLFYGEASLNRLSDGKILGVMRDASDRKHSESEREALKDQLFRTKKNEAMNRLSRSVAKDFGALIEDMQQDLKHLKSACQCNPQAQKMIFSLSASCQKGQDFIDDLVTYAHKDSSSVSQVNLEKIVQNVILSFETSVNGHVDIDFKPQIVGAHVIGSIGEIQRALLNILKNSYESMPLKSSARIEIKLDDLKTLSDDFKQLLSSQHKAPQDEVLSFQILKMEESLAILCGSLKPEHSYHHLRIIDFGMGIDADILPSIFDPYFTTKKNEKALGLGLTEVLTTLQASGGAILVETKLAQGTIVHLFLPAAV